MIHLLKATYLICLTRLYLKYQRYEPTYVLSKQSCFQTFLVLMYILSHLIELHLKFILQYLSSEDVVKLSQVSTRLHSVLQDNLLWKYLFVRDWIWKQVCSSRNRCKYMAQIVREFQCIYPWYLQKTARLNHGNPKSFGQLKKAVVVKNDRTWKSEYVRLKDRVPKHKV